ncbi:MAG: phosphoenolpyruvate carboxylase [Wenzhouxiangellaceae bacterium]
MSDTQQKLSTTIRLLGDLLGEVLSLQEGAQLFAVEERFRLAAKERRQASEPDSDELRRLAAELAAEPARALAVLKAFETYFQLVNLAEEQHRVRILCERSHHAHEQGMPLRESIAAAVHHLHEQGVTAAELQTLLHELAVIPVFTAHPTEARRRVVLKKLRSMAKALDRWEDERRFPAEHERAREWMYELITTLWQTSETRANRPTVDDEVGHGLYFFANIIYQRLPLIYEDLEHALERYYPGHTFVLPTFLRYGSWMGGDRDGNPYVDQGVTRRTLARQHQQIIELYIDEVRTLREHLTMSLRRSDFSSTLLDSLKRDQRLLGAALDKASQRYADEPYRLKLSAIELRLQQNLEAAEAWHRPRASDTIAYRSPDDLIHDLFLIEDSLREHSGPLMAHGRLGRLLRRVRIFGFHLAALDLRQHAEVHHHTVAELMRADGLHDDYTALDEAQRQQLLVQHMHRDGAAMPLPKLDGQAAECAGLFELVAEALAQLGEDSIGSYIISMTTSAVDMLEVLWLASRAGLFGRLSIAPLFETISDLQAAPAVMQALFDLPLYRDHLDQLQGPQEIMIGYSDSNKDGGFMMANWSLYQGQRALAACCREAGVRWTFFHGRGGSIGRGGGPANRAILAQPAGSVHGRIKLTEQGEVISARYANPDIAQRHLSQLLSAVLITSVDQAQTTPEPWREVMGALAEQSYRCYRQLVEDPHFIQYFLHNTPIEAIGKLNIGSRPTKRKATAGVADLRAIPWVFAWSQTRINLPGWYGLGSALEQWLQDNGKNGLTLLREMYREWPMFRSLVDNAQLSLYRADIDIAAEYSDLGEAPHNQQVFQQISDEFKRSRNALLRITDDKELLDHMPWFQRSVQLRNPYVDPLSYLQVALMRRLQNNGLSEEERDDIEAALLLSINGISAGLQNTG